MAAQDFLAGDWLVQPSRGVASRAGSSTHLEPKAMGVLAHLADHPGQVVAKEDLIGAVWPGVFVTDNVLTSAVWQLRQVLGADAVQTVPKRGYRLALPVQPSRQPIESLAVLPLVNLSGDPGEDYFADGMTEALTTALAQIGTLHVISHTSVMRYKGTTRTLPQIGAELKVSAVVEGSVIRAGDRVRIAVQLLDAPSDRHLWAKNFDTHLRDTLDLQDEVARTIAAEIGVTLTPAEQVRLTRPRPVNPAAQDAYLKGRYYHMHVSEESVRVALDCMREAATLDPGFALAHAGLATVAGTLGAGAVGGISPAEAVAIIRPAVQRALDLDPDLPEALSMQGWLRLFWDWDWAGAEASHRRALSVCPSYALGHGSLAWVHSALGRGDEAIASWWQACSLDPLSPLCRVFYGYVLALFGRYDQAIEHLRGVIQLEPRFYYPHAILGGSLAMLGRFDEAIAETEEAARLAPDPVVRGYLGYAYGAAGRRNAAMAVLDELERLAEHRYVNHVLPAAVLAGLGDTERCIDYLEQAAEAHDADIVQVRVFPLWRGLRGHPRFEALVRRLNFPD